MQQRAGYTTGGAYVGGHQGAGYTAGGAYTGGHHAGRAGRQGNTKAAMQPCYTSHRLPDQPRGIVFVPFVSGCCDENNRAENGCPFVTGWAGPFYDNPCGFGVWPCCTATTFGAPSHVATDNDGVVCNTLCRVPCPCVVPCLGFHCLCWLGTGFCFCTAPPCTEQYVTAAYARNYPSCVKTTSRGGGGGGGGHTGLQEIMAAPGLQAMRRDDDVPTVFGHAVPPPKEVLLEVQIPTSKETASERIQGAVQREGQPCRIPKC